jgi:hypothetical protein
MPSRQVSATPAWREGHDWHIDRTKLEAIAQRAGLSTTFICGTAADEGKIRDLFVKMIYLLIDETTLRRRIDEGTGRDFEKELRRKR